MAGELQVELVGRWAAAAAVLLAGGIPPPAVPPAGRAGRDCGTGRRPEDDPAATMAGGARCPDSHDASRAGPRERALATSSRRSGRSTRRRGHGSPVRLTARRVRSWRVGLSRSPRRSLAHRSAPPDDPRVRAITDAEVVPHTPDLGHGTSRCTAAAASASHESAAAARARAAVAVFRALEAAPLGLVVFDRELRFVHVNAWMARVNDLTREAHLGHTMRELFPRFPRQVARTEARIGRCSRPAAPRCFGDLHRADDRRHDWMATYFPVRLASGEIHCVCGIIADVTADREREATLARARRAAERTSRRLGYLQDVTAALAASKDPATVAGVVVDRVRPLVGAAAATLRVVRGDALEFLAASGRLQVPAHLRSVPLGAAYPVAAAVSRGEPIWLEDRAALEARFPEALEAFGSAEALGVVPLTAHGRSIGSIAFVFESPQAFDLEDRAFLLAAAAQSAQALDRALANAAERTSRHLAQRATHRLARLQAITAALSGASTVEEVATVLVHGSRATLGAQTAVTYVLERATSTLSLVAALGAADSHRSQLGTLPLDAPAPAAYAARTGEAIWLPTRAELRAAFPGSARSRRTPARSARWPRCRCGRAGRCSGRWASRSERSGRSSRTTASSSPRWPISAPRHSTAPGSSTRSARRAPASAVPPSGSSTSRRSRPRSRPRARRRRSPPR